MFKKHLGQHFLTDPKILGRIAAALDGEPGDSVLEIGPGRGSLTTELVRRGFAVTAVERDRELIPELRHRFPTVAIAEGDALDVDWHALAVRGSTPAPWFVIGNIPYNITSPLIDKALEPPRPRQIVFLVQREVADRLVAPAGVSEYGALSVGVQSVAKVERLFRVRAGAFHPPPRVDSAVVRLTPRVDPLFADAEASGFRRFVTALFSVRRKQLGRGLRIAAGLSIDAAAGALAEAGIAETERPERLEPSQFIQLYRSSLTGSGRVR
ncbi:MAG: 16S rRNA (adenine(1518)-N(6)/adenine(1519)-N(6))-dimethyltransferase RsmA [Gemmatimonadota bacterium]